MKIFSSPLTVVFALLAAPVWADDWPQWMGPQRDDVWRERGIVQRFTTNGPPIVWRTAIAPSYSGPAVVGNRLFLMDRPKAADPEAKSNDEKAATTPALERVRCLDAKTGKSIWEHVYPRAYNIGYPAGPRTTPTVADGRVYTLGAMGDLLCLKADSGTVVWSHNFPQDYQPVKAPVWGWSSHPLLDADRLICLVGGTNTAVVAFQKDTGKELWRALSTQEIGYVPPVIYTINGRRQRIIWHPEAVSGLDPETGKVFWSQPYPVGAEPKRPEVTIALPRLEGNNLFLTCFYQGSLLLRVTETGAEVAWNRHSTSDSEMNDGLHTVLGTPIFKDGFIYGVCGFGEFRCLDAKNGDRKWETYAPTVGKQGFFANVFMTQNEDRTFLYNDQGELIIARLRPEGYEEVSRAKLLEPLEKTRGRTVTWCHPAYANQRAYVHNGKDLICVSLAADQG